MITPPPPHPTAVRIYLDPNDWWIGYYRGPNHHYVCLLPTIVIRWRRHPPTPHPTPAPTTTSTHKQT